MLYICIWVSLFWTRILINYYGTLQIRIGIKCNIEKEETPYINWTRLKSSTYALKKGDSFSRKAAEFLRKTERFVNEGVNPGGYYKAVWCRDASYILKDWFLSGSVAKVMQEILYIWSHQIN